MRLLRPLTDRDFALLIVGTLISMIGDGIYLVAITYATLTLSPGPGALSIVGGAMATGLVLFVVAGGVLADRHNKRRVLIGSDIVRFLALIAVVATAFGGTLEIWHLVGLSFIYGAGEGLGAPAMGSIVPEILDGERLVAGNALAGSLRPVAQRFVGPAIGGGVVALAGTRGAFAIDAATFLVSIACLAAMRGHRPALATEHEPLRTQLREAATFVRAHTWLWATLLMAALAVLCFFGPTEVLVPVLIKDEFDQGAGAYGAVLAAIGLGTVLGTFVIGQRGIPAREITVLYGFWAVAVLGLCGYAVSQAAWQVAAFGFAFGIGEGVGAVIWATLMQVRVPEQLRGRVSSLDWLLSLALMPVSFVVTAPIAELIGVRETLMLAGLLACAATAGVYLLMPSLRAEDGGLARARAD